MTLERAIMNLWRELKKFFLTFTNLKILWRKTGSEVKYEIWAHLDSNFDLQWRSWRQCFLKEFKGHQRSRISEKVEKGQMSIYSESMQIIYQNDPLDLDHSKKLISRSRKVTRGQKSSKRSKKVKCRFTLNVCKFYMKIALSTYPFQKIWF